MKKLILKLFLLTLVLGTFAIPGKAHAILGTWVGCANWYCGAEGQHIEEKIGPYKAYELPDWAYDQCSTESDNELDGCVEAREECRDALVNAVHNNCTYQESSRPTYTCTGNAYDLITDYIYGTQYNVVFATGVKSRCEEAQEAHDQQLQQEEDFYEASNNGTLFGDLEPSNSGSGNGNSNNSGSAQPAGPCDGLTGNELQTCEFWQAMAGLTPTQQQQFQYCYGLSDPELQNCLDLVEIANMDPAQQAILQGLYALAQLSPLEQAQLKNCYGKQGTELQECLDLVELSFLTPEELADLEDYVAAQNAPANGGNQNPQGHQGNQDDQGQDHDSDDQALDGHTLGEQPNFTLPEGAEITGGCSLQVAEAGNLSNLLFLIVGLLPLAVTGIRKK